MTDMEMTRHALQRIRQRGRSQADIELVLRFGTHLAPDCCVLLNRDADQRIARLKREIALLERLRGWKVVEDHGLVITTYKPPRIRKLQGPRPR
jgi:hypothetical protein